MLSDDMDADDVDAEVHVEVYMMPLASLLLQELMVRDGGGRRASQDVSSFFFFFFFLIWAPLLLQALMGVRCAVRCTCIV
jgi:hypothetical protein